MYYTCPMIRGGLAAHPCTSERNRPGTGVFVSVVNADRRATRSGLLQRLVSWIIHDTSIAGPISPPITRSRKCRGLSVTRSSPVDSESVQAALGCTLSV